MVCVVPLPGHCSLFLFVFAIPVPGDNITPPLYISTESCASLLQAEWQQIISWSLHTAKYIQPWYGIKWKYVMIKAKQAWCLLAFYWYLLCCALVTKVFVKQILAVDHNVEYLEFEDLFRLAPIDGSLSSKSVKQILWSPRHNTIDTSKDARRHHACLAHDINLHTIIKAEIFAVGKDQVAIQPVTVIHNFLLIHIVEEKFCHQVPVLLWTKITWAVTRKWHNSNQTLSL